MQSSDWTHISETPKPETARMYAACAYLWLSGWDFYHIMHELNRGRHWVDCVVRHFNLPRRETCGSKTWYWRDR